MDRMSGILSKPLREVTLDDIRALCDGDGVAEHDNLEFKEGLDETDGRCYDEQLKSWKLGREASKDVLKEVVAFANARGGTLVIGIEERGGSPPRAGGLKPLPECEQLRSKLHDLMREAIDPRLPAFDSHPVCNGDSTEGFVVIRVPQSHRAPHRSTKDRECYRRRRDQSVKMTMYEIQDLTRQVDRGMDQLEKRFAGMRSDFQEGIARSVDGIGPSFSMAAARVSASSLNAPIEVPLSLNDYSFYRQIERSFNYQYGKQKWDGLDFRLPSHSPIPRLRQVRFENFRSVNSFSPYRGAVSLGWDGSVNAYSCHVRTDGEPASLLTGHLVATLAAVAHESDVLRTAAGAPDSAYAIEVELNTSQGVHVTRLDNINPWLPAPSGETVFPRYQFSSRASFEDVSAAFWRDFMNAMGQWEQHNGPLKVSLD